MTSNPINSHISAIDTTGHEAAPNGLASQGDNDEELLQNVLQDIANQTKKENFKKNTRGVADTDYERAAAGKEVTFQPPVDDNISEYEEPSPYVPYQPSKMDVLKESFKWSAIVSLLIFVFSQPKVINKIALYAPSRLLSGQDTLNVWGSLFVAVLGGFIYFALFQWIL
jgi:hypothetical protein